MTDFKETKKLFKATISEILSKNSSYEIDEAALPAYAHKNPLIDLIFWKRVETAVDFVSRHNAKNVLDFGCGTGLLSYALASNDVRVTAIDLDFRPLNLVREKISFPSTINFIEGNLLERDLPENSFDFIIALDVLEHITDLSPWIREFRRLLKPGGKVIVSGPTENTLYKIGRKLAGNKFTGDYHVSDIKKIRKEFEKEMNTSTLKRLIWPLVLFEIFIAD